MSQHLARALDEVVPKSPDGGHRSLSPEETLERVRPWASEMGITRVADITGLDRLGIPVAMACRPNSRSLAVSQGKGRTLRAAQASALMESIETYHAERITLPLILATYDELRQRASVIDVERVVREVDNSFHPHQILLWIAGFDMIQCRTVWLPYELVHTNYSLPLPTGSGCFPLTSNGLASGNNLLEAISHGLCEVVERDASTLCRVQRELPRLDLSTVKSPSCEEVLAKCFDAGVAVSVWETTSDIGIPSFECAVQEDRVDPLHPVPWGIGMGCHPVRELALLRAVTEAAQCRLTMIAGSRDDVGWTAYDLLIQGPSRMGIPDATGPERSFSDGCSFESETLNEELEWELGRLERRGLNEVVVVDLSDDRYRIPVVRVVVPGLEIASISAMASFGERARQQADSAR